MIKSDPREIVRREFFNLLQGKTPDIARIRKYKGEVETAIKNQGSNNWIYGVAAVEGDLDWFSRAMASERLLGLETREAGSSTYGADRIPYKLYALSLARKRKHPVAEILASNLRAWWAVCALSSVNVPIIEFRILKHEKSVLIGGTHKYYSGGVSIALPSPRQGPSFENQLAPLFSWALGLSVKWTRTYKEEDSRTYAYWPIRAVELVLGKRLGEFTSSALWGLEPGDRLSCTEIIKGSEDLSDIDFVQNKMRQNWKLFGNLNIIRAKKYVMSYLNQGQSSWKPTVLLSKIDTNGICTMVMPQISSRSSSSFGSCTRKGNLITCEGDGKFYAISIETDSLIYDISIPSAHDN